MIPPGSMFRFANTSRSLVRNFDQEGTTFNVRLHGVILLHMRKRTGRVPVLGCRRKATAGAEEAADAAE